MNLTFSLAGPADQDVLVSLVRQLREDDPEEGTFDEQATIEAMAALLADSLYGAIWLIHVDQQLAGYVALTFAYSIEFGGRIAFVDELFIERPHRGKGLGRAALEFVEARAKESGVRVLLLEVTQSNASAKRLYGSAGYLNRPHQLMAKRID